MKKILVLLVAFLLAASSWGALADTTLMGNGFQMTLGEGWSILDAASQANVSHLASGMAPAGTCMAVSENGASLCAYIQPSQGMNIQFMELFQSEYVWRIEEAIAPIQAENVSGAQTLCGANNVYCLSFTAAGVPVAVYYSFSSESVVTAIFTNAESEEMAQILSTLSIQEVASPPQS